MTMSIGKNIKTMRQKCGFTQEELAARLAVTPQAISKWENENGAPDITQLIPLAQIFAVTTDSLLGINAASYGEAHVQAAEGHEELLMNTSQSEAEKHLACYTYYRAESDKEPTNYMLMKKCLSHGAALSRYTDFDGFLSDKPELRDDIFADCERRNLCISRYCETQATIERSDYCMSWIYIHTQEYDKARRLIERLPSLKSNKIRESIQNKLIRFQYGFEKEKPYIQENLISLFRATYQEFFFSLEDYTWFGDPKEAIAYGKNALSILDSYSCIEELQEEIIECKKNLQTFLTKCYNSLES